MKRFIILPTLFFGLAGYIGTCTAWNNNEEQVDQPNTQQQELPSYFTADQQEFLIKRLNQEDRDYRLPQTLNFEKLAQKIFSTDDKEKKEALCEFIKEKTVAEIKESHYDKQQPYDDQSQQASTSWQTIAKNFSIPAAIAIIGTIVYHLSNKKSFIARATTMGVSGGLVVGMIAEKSYNYCMSTEQPKQEQIRYMPDIQQAWIARKRELDILISQIASSHKQLIDTESQKLFKIYVDTFTQRLSHVYATKAQTPQ